MKWKGLGGGRGLLSSEEEERRRREEEMSGSARGELSEQDYIDSGAWRGKVGNDGEEELRQASLEEMERVQESLTKED